MDYNPNDYPFSTAAVYLNGTVKRFDQYALPVSGDDLARIKTGVK